MFTVLHKFFESFFTIKKIVEFKKKPNSFMCSPLLEDLINKRR